MTDELDSTFSEGTPGSPNSGTSQGQGEQNSNVAAKLQTALDTLVKRLDKVDERTKMLQGDKDKGVQKAVSEVEELKRKIAEIEKLKKSGYDEDTAVDEFSFREDVRAIKDQLSRFNQVPAPPTGNGQGEADKVAKVVESYGFTNNDVDANALIQQFGKDPETLDGKLAKLYVQRQRTPSNPAQSAAPQGISPAPVDVASKISRLAELQKFPSKNLKEINALEKELDAANWGG